MAPSSSNNCKGLTLIEVLIALAIIGIALTAIIKATTQTIGSNNYLQTKTLATYAGVAVLNQIQLGLLELPDNEALTLDETLLNLHWYGKAMQSKTPNPRIVKITVQIFPSETSVSPLITLSTYRMLETGSRHGKT